MFSPDITVWALLSQVLAEDQSLQAAVSRVIAFYIAQGWEAPSSNTSAYSQARMRLSEGLLMDLTKKSAEQLEASAQPSWLWEDKSVKLVDGSTVSMPDTEENQAAYPQMRAQKKRSRFSNCSNCGSNFLCDRRYFGLGNGPLFRERNG